FTPVGAAGPYGVQGRYHAVPFLTLSVLALAAVKRRLAWRASPRQAALDGGQRQHREREERHRVIAPLHAVGAGGADGGEDGVEREDGRRDRRGHARRRRRARPPGRRARRRLFARSS